MKWYHPSIQAVLHATHCIGRPDMVSLPNLITYHNFMIYLDDGRSQMVCYEGHADHMVIVEIHGSALLFVFPRYSNS